MTASFADLRKFIADFDFSDKSRDCYREAKERFLGITDEQFDLAFYCATHGGDEEEEVERHQQRLAVGEFMRAAVSHIPGARVIVGVRAAAARGEPFATEVVNRLEECARMHDKLFRAAASVHPDWSITGNSALGPPEGHPQDSPDRLIEWFQKTHSIWAREIEAEARK